MFYHDIVLFLHLVGLVVSVGIGITNLVIGRLAAPAATPDGAAALRSLSPMLFRIAVGGLALLIVTGLLLLFQRGFSFLSFWFWVKMVGVAGMVGIVYLMFQAMAQAKAGDTTAPAKLRMLGPAMLGTALPVVLVAIFASH